MIIRYADCRKKVSLFVTLIKYLQIYCLYNWVIITLLIHRWRLFWNLGGNPLSKHYQVIFRRLFISLCNRFNFCLYFLKLKIYFGIMVRITQVISYLGNHTWMEKLQFSKVEYFQKLSKNEYLLMQLVQQKQYMC